MDITHISNFQGLFITFSLALFTGLYMGLFASAGFFGGLLAFLFVFVFLSLLFLILKNELPDKWRSVIYYLYLIRIPLIGGLVLTLFPFIANWTPASLYLQNLFVIENSGLKLFAAIIITAINSLSIIQFIRAILVRKNLSLIINYQWGEYIVFTLLFVPTVFFLYLNNKPENVDLHIPIPIVNDLISSIVSGYNIISFILYFFLILVIAFISLFSIYLIDNSAYVGTKKLRLLYFLETFNKLSDNDENKIEQLNDINEEFRDFKKLDKIVKQQKKIKKRTSQFFLRRSGLMESQTVKLLLTWLVFSEHILNDGDALIQDIRKCIIKFEKTEKEEILYEQKQLKIDDLGYLIKKILVKKGKLNKDELNEYKDGLSRLENIELIDKVVDGKSYIKISDIFKTYLFVSLLFGLIGYLIVFIVNFPDAKWQFRVPTLISVMSIIWIIVFSLGTITFYTDQWFEKVKANNPSHSQNQKYIFRVPVILLLFLNCALSYGAFNVDHYFRLQNSNLPALVGSEDLAESSEFKFQYPEDINKAISKRLNKQTTPEKTLVVIATSGGGIQASGWTAQVLAGLQEEIGENFTKAIGLISSVSGGSVGTMFYLDEFDKGILKKDAQETVFENATHGWLDSIGWGLAYPDLSRIAGFPFILLTTGDNKYIDRGYALEQAWRKDLTTLSKQTLDDWYMKAKDGDIPIPVFNSTLAENGRRFLISPMKFVSRNIEDYFNGSEELQQSRALDFRTLYDSCGEKGNQPCTIDIVTAARLSATFPYISPMARNDEENVIRNSNGEPIIDKKTDKPILQNYHMTDGGYFDNAGAFTAIEWLNKFLDSNVESLNIKKVILLQINAFEEIRLKPQEKGDLGFLTVIYGPLKALGSVRDSTQVARNIQAVKLLKDKWNNKDKQINIQEFVISFPEISTQKNRGKQENVLYKQPLSWKLTNKNKQDIKDVWNKDIKIRYTVECMKNFLDKGMGCE